VSRLNDLLRQLEAKDAALAKELRREYDVLADRRAFGLNFERHTPEKVELPGRKVRKGDKVHILPERGKNPTKDNTRLWRVVAIDRTSEPPVASLEALDDAEAAEAEVGELVVVAEFRDPIYPGLVSTGPIERGGDQPIHTVISAENYRDLQTLLFTHRDQVDCIYIDPPYNTGNEGWIYNDKYVAGDDHYKHSKWLAFMERRLLLAKELLKPTGVLIVAIGEAEHHRLRMLLDQVFGAENFLANIVWQGGVNNDAAFTGGGLDYMVCYGLDERLLSAVTRWKEPKDGAERVIASANEAFDATGDEAAATALHRKWLRANKSGLEGVLPLFNTVIAPGRAARVNGDLSSASKSTGFYDLLHPTLGVPVPRPARGWGYTEENMQRLIDEGRVYFPPNNDSIPQGIAFLDERLDAVPRPSFTRERFLASRHLDKILGERRFPNPKDHIVIQRWLRMVAPPDALVVDFFGGSGTTAEAVMRLNDEDGGTRRCILVTNNEAAVADAKRLRKVGHRPGDPEWEKCGVYEYVTKPRISTVAAGARPDGSTYSDGLEQNVEFLTLTYEAPLRVSSNREFAKIAPLLWMRAGTAGRRIDDISAGWDVADTYGVLADLDQSEKFVRAVADAGDQVAIVYVVTDEDRLFQSVVRELPPHIEAVRLYEAYLRNFEIESGRSVL